MGVKQGPCISLVKLHSIRHAPDKSKALTVLVTAASFTTFPSASTAFLRKMGAMRPVQYKR